MAPTKKQITLLNGLLKEAQRAEPSETCYLDGRYFDLVFKGFKEWHPVPLKLSFTLVPEGVQVMQHNEIDFKDHQKESTILLRVIIEVYKQQGKYKRLLSRHSNLFIVDQVNYTITRFDPVGDQYPESLLVDHHFRSRSNNYQYLSNNLFHPCSGYIGK